MRSANLNSFDLNLIKVFLAIWELKSLTAAGDRLGLTQPAVSHALRRLRQLLDDPLFVRMGNQMMPTDAAAQLYHPFYSAMRIVSQTVKGHGEFVPATSTRTFRIAMSDLAELFFLPRLLARIETQGPFVRVDCVGMEAETIEASLRSGQVDIALGFLPHIGEECRGTKLFDDSFVCLVRKDHPLSGTQISADQFNQLTYVDISSRSTSYKFVAETLEAAGVRRAIRARLMHFLGALDIVRQTNFAVLFPRSASERANFRNDFRLLSLPFDLPSIPFTLFTHSHFDADLGIKWLRQVVLDTLPDGRPEGG